MKKILMAACCIALLSSCNSKKSSGTENFEGDSIPVDPNLSGKICYGSALKKDTVMLMTDIYGGTVSGNLTYNLYEKDRNSGTISGAMIGDTLLADYTYMSEGKESVREVIFLKKDSVLLEGFGNMKEVNGKFVFDSHTDIIFGNGIVLRPVPCK